MFVKSSPGQVLLLLLAQVKVKLRFRFLDHVLAAAAGALDDVARFDREQRNEKQREPGAHPEQLFAAGVAACRAWRLIGACATVLHKVFGSP